MYKNPPKATEGTKTRAKSFIFLKYSLYSVLTPRQVRLLGCRKEKLQDTAKSLLCARTFSGILTDRAVVPCASDLPLRRKHNRWEEKWETLFVCMFHIMQKNKFKAEAAHWMVRK